MKKIIWIFLILYIIVLVSFIMTLDKNNYVLFGTTTTIYYDNNNQIKNIKKSNKLNGKLNYEKLNVYNNGKFQEGYINLYKEDNSIFYNIYNKNQEKIKSNNLLLAYKGDINIKVNQSEIQNKLDSNEKNKLLNILKNKGINEDITYFSKQELDLDNDAQKETIYTLSNYGGKINNISYSYIFVRSNNEVIDVTLIKNENKNSPENPQKYHVWSVDIDNDNAYEIVVSSTNGDDSPVYYEFYKFDSSNKKIVELK